MIFLLQRSRGVMPRITYAVELAGADAFIASTKPRRNAADHSPDATPCFKPPGRVVCERYKIIASRLRTKQEDTSQRATVIVRFLKNFALNERCRGFDSHRSARICKAQTWRQTIVGSRATGSNDFPKLMIFGLTESAGPRSIMTT